MDDVSTISVHSETTFRDGRFSMGVEWEDAMSIIEDSQVLGCVDGGAWRRLTVLHHRYGSMVVLLSVAGSSMVMGDHPGILDLGGERHIWVDKEQNNLVNLRKPLPS